MKKELPSAELVLLLRGGVPMRDCAEGPEIRILGKRDCAEGLEFGRRFLGFWVYRCQGKRHA